LTAAGAAALPQGSLVGEPGRLLITFLGLVAASILPTVSLILQSMTASGRSVLRITELQKELRSAVDTLFVLFALAAAAVLVLLALSMRTPEPLRVVSWLPAVLERSGQAIVGFLTMTVLVRSGRIPGIIRRSLDIRGQIAIDEARRKTVEKAPKAGQVSERFQTRAGFGQTVSLSEVREEKPQH
jgi:hypothetical protein